MKKLVPIIWVLCVIVSGCQAPETEPTESPESYKPEYNYTTPDYEKIHISGETTANGVYDPSIEYSNGTGWMVYSAVKAPKYVHTQLAKSTDHGKTWEYITTINRSIDSTLETDTGTIEGAWRHEVPTLVYDPEDPGKEWKLFWHKYFTKPPYQEEDRMFQYGWIAYRYASHPDGKWSEEISLLGSGLGLQNPFETIIDLNRLHKTMSNMVVYSEPGSLMYNNTLYLSINGHTIQNGKNIGNVFLIASHDHGKTWKYVNVLLTPEDAQKFDSLFFTGSSLVEVDNRIFLLACPEDPAREMHHGGTCIFEFEDITKGTLRKDKEALIVIKYFLPSLTSGGQSDYDEQNTNGGIVFPQIDPASYPDVFQIYNTGEGII